MKLNNIVETESGFERNSLKDTADMYQAVMRQENAARHYLELAQEQLNKFRPHALTSYTGEDWGEPVSHEAKFGWSYWAMPVSIPNGDQLWNTIEYYGKRVDRAFKAMKKYNRLSLKLKKAYRVETFNDLKSAEKSVIPSTQVPRRIYYSATNYFNNPYWIRDDVVNRYAGPVGHFPYFTAAEQSTLVELERTLRHFGILGLKTLYGVTLKHGKRQQNKFVVIGGDERFIWKRIGGNVVYVDGKRVSISYLTGTTWSNKQKDILEPLIPKEKV